MDIEGVPLLGTPKQNGYIIKLAGSLGFVNLMTAVNTALARPLNTVIANPFNMADASKVISALLEKCAAAGISTYSAKGKGKRGKRKEKAAPVPAAVPPPEHQPPLPVAGDTLEEAFQRMPSDQQRFVLEKLSLFYSNRGGNPLEIYSASAVAGELASRAEAKGELLKVIPPPELCGELERRGLPAGFLITDPDAVAVAPRALEWIDWNFSEAPKSARAHACSILRDAGREVKDGGAVRLPRFPGGHE